MHVQITIRIDGREAGSLYEQVSGTAAEIEEQTLRFQRRTGRIIVENGLNQIADQAKHPRCCVRSMENRGRRCRTILTQHGEVVIERTRYRCRNGEHHSTPADAQI